MWPLDSGFRRNDGIGVWRLCLPNNQAKEGARAAMGRFEVATVGDNCIDRYLPPIALATVGGNAVNVAVHLRRLGRRTAYFGAVGEDREGRWTRA